ncbi:MAG: hypothetical protein S4CHLAM81_04230 [Chlamydiales bacterium]|nr:hypothetical protein [Chlamydiales bacterium]MCH9635212.1 hypothetical protein [Chlamydiales bacterium]MCH9703180.1 hypothetical protein [Chlamydiota bacterium]
MEPTSRGSPLGSTHSVQPAGSSQDRDQISHAAAATLLTQKLPSSGAVGPPPVELSDYAVTRAYLTGKGHMPIDPKLPANKKYSGSDAQIEESFKGHVEERYMQGSLEMARFDLTALREDVTKSDLPRQVNLINGEQLSPKEYLAALKDKPDVVRYSNQNLLSPVSTEVFRHYQVSGILATGHRGVAVNHYQNEDDEDCIEGVWLGSIKMIESGKELYHVEGRMEVNVKTKRAHMEWKLSLPVKGKRFTVLHGRDGDPEGIDYKLSGEE